MREKAREKAGEKVREKAREKAREKERKRKKERDKFCVINVKYKEISWRVRGEEEKSNF